MFIVSAYIIVALLIVILAGAMWHRKGKKGKKPNKSQSWCLREKISQLESQQTALLRK